MRIVFIGTPDFAAYSLESLLNAGHEIVGVITAPDRKAGRGQKVQESAVKKVAVANQLPCLQPKNLKDPTFIRELESYKAELQVVVAFRMLPERVWSMPPKGTMNLHASLLPAYRGAAPINWAIINGEKVTGLSTFLLKHEIDTGEVILRRTVPIEERETAGSLHDKLMKTGAELLVESVELIANDQVSPIPQNQLVPEGSEIEDLPLAPKIFREDCRISWEKEAQTIDHFIRGLSPYPAAWTKLNRISDDKEFNLKIYNCMPSELESVEVGKINVADNHLYISCGDKQLEILELQMEGKKRMSSRDFLNGINLDDYEKIVS